MNEYSLLSYCKDSAFLTFHGNNRNENIVGNEKMTKQGVPWLEIVLRGNERKMLSFVEKWKKVKKRKRSDGSKRVKGRVDFFKRKRKRERRKDAEKNWFFNRLRVSTTPETRNVSTSLIGWSLVKNFSWYKNLIIGQPWRI